MSNGISIWNTHGYEGLALLVVLGETNGDTISAMLKNIDLTHICILNIRGMRTRACLFSSGHGQVSLAGQNTQLADQMEAAGNPQGRQGKPLPP